MSALLVGSLREARRKIRPGGAQAREQWKALCEEALRELWADALAQCVGGADDGEKLARVAGVVEEKPNGGDREASVNADEVRGLALAAVGSLGRGDCGPESDLDLMLLHDGLPHPEIRGGVQALAERLWYPLWDSHVEIDHSVRSLAECRGVASRDISASVALLDIRCIAGDAELVDRASRLVHQDWRAGARTRFSQLVDEQDRRVQRAGELAYAIEGNLKESAGGLRDVVVLRALVASWLAERPAINYAPAYDFLLDVRDALAYVTRRHGHILSIRLQDEVASLLGFTGEGAADELLARLSNAARIIRGAYSDTFARAQRNLSHHHRKPRLVRGHLRRPLLDEVAPGVAAVSDELVFASEGSIRLPNILLTMAAASVRTGIPIRQATLASIRERGGVYPVAGGAARGLLEEILAGGHSQISVWEQLDLFDFLSDLVPAWREIRHLPQRSIVHRHTVDRHQIEVVALLASLRAFDGSEPASLSSRRRTSLLFAGFLHDVGKRMGIGGHEERGALIAREAVERMGYERSIAGDVENLVRHHLLLGDLSTSANPHDPATRQTIADAVGKDAELLACLHLLTQADALACKEGTWDEWKASLVTALVVGASADLA